MAVYRSNPERLRRSRIFYSIGTVFTLFIIFFLLDALQSLIMPTLIGMVAAYLSYPGLNYLRRRGIPKGLGVLVLFAVIILAIFTLGRQIYNIIPDEDTLLELRVSTEYQINKQYLNFFGLENFADTEGNFIFDLLGNEVKPVLAAINGVIQLSYEEEMRFLELVEAEETRSGLTTNAHRYYEELEKMDILITDLDGSEINEESEEGGFSLQPKLDLAPSNSKIASFLSAISIWFIFPFVYIFLLLDEGEVKHFFMGLVPNRYFEMAFTTFNNVDEAIGKYLRGTLLQCSLVGLVFIVGLLLFGFELQAALLIGIIAGLANAIPFLGPVLGLLVGVLYALIAQDLTPIIPFFPPDRAIMGVLIVVLIAQGLDNAVFAPMVLGKAVNLHPLVVVLGVTGGSILLGFAGMLFAIPTIVIVTQIVSTLMRQLKAYFIIY